MTVLGIIAIPANIWTVLLQYLSSYHEVLTIIFSMIFLMIVGLYFADYYALIDEESV